MLFVYILLTAMESDNKKKNTLVAYLSEMFHCIVPVIKSKYLYIGILSIIAGAVMNFASETYLHNYMSEGKTLADALRPDSR